MNNLINKIGIDKIAHFGIGGVICAFITLMFIFSMPYENTLELNWSFVLFCPLIGYWLVSILAFFKELNDTTPDKKDFFASLLGCVFIHFGAIIGYLFHFGNGKNLITSTWGTLLVLALFTIYFGFFTKWAAKDSKKKYPKVIMWGLFGLGIILGILSIIFIFV